MKQQISNTTYFVVNGLLEFCTYVQLLTAIINANGIPTSITAIQQYTNRIYKGLRLAFDTSDTSAYAQTYLFADY